MFEREMNDQIGKAPRGMLRVSEAVMLVGRRPTMGSGSCCWSGRRLIGAPVVWD